MLYNVNYRIFTKPSSFTVDFGDLILISVHIAATILFRKLKIAVYIEFSTEMGNNFPKNNFPTTS